MTFSNLIEFIIKNVDYINITLRYLLLRIICKKFIEKKILLNCIDRFCI